MVFRQILNFKLVLNATQKNIDPYFAGKKIPKNLNIFTVQNNLHPFYQWADVLLNLSHIDSWIETFGLTILEGLCYHLPAIVPPIGGPTELITDGKNGYLIDSHQGLLLNEKLNHLLTHHDVYIAMKANTALAVKNFQEASFKAKIRQLISN